MERSEILREVPTGVAEVDLVNEGTWGAIRALRERGFSRKRIARELSLDVKTVRKWIRESWRPRVTGRRVRELDGFEEFLKARAPEVGFNGQVLMREVRERGYGGSYSALARRIGPWRCEFGGGLEPTVRFETGPGEQGQVDWGSTAVYLGEDLVRVHLFVMVLSYSRRIFARGYLQERLEDLLDGHERAFAHFCGRTRRILYDNPRTIVKQKDEAINRVVWNGTFKDRMDFWGVEIQLCRYYRAQTKGKVESGVKYVKRNALAGRRFRDLEELNAYLLSWCVEVADVRLHGTTHERPSERFQRERELLFPVDTRPAPPRERLLVRRVPKDAYVAVETNRYPVPFSWMGRDVEVRVLSVEISIASAGESVTHRRLSGCHQVARWDGPPRSLPRRDRVRVAEPPRLSPSYLEEVGTVEVRPLESYQLVSEGVSS
jgi:transposase